MGLGAYGPGVREQRSRLRLHPLRSNITGTIGSVETAETVINTPADQTSVVNADRERCWISWTPAGAATSPIRQPVSRNVSIGEGLSNIVMQATGTLKITASQAGYYTFGVNSDDGFS